MLYRGLGSGIIRALKEDSDIKFINDEEGNQFITVICRDTSLAETQGVDGKTQGVNSRSKVTIQRLLDFCQEPKSLTEITEYFNIKDKYFFKKRYINLLLGSKLTLTDKKSPTSPLQKYVLIK